MISKHYRRLTPIHSLAGKLNSLSFIFPWSPISFNQLVCRRPSLNRVNMDSRSFFIFSYLCTRQIIILIHKQFQYWWSMCLVHTLFWVLLTNSLSSQSMFLERHTVCVNYIVVLITKPLSAHCFQLHSFIHSFISFN